MTIMEHMASLFIGRTLTLEGGVYGPILLIGISKEMYDWPTLETYDDKGNHRYIHPHTEWELTSETIYESNN